MRKLIVWNMMTLEGYLSGTSIITNSLGAGVGALLAGPGKGIGTLLFGRKTYEGMAVYWSTTAGDIAEFMNSVPKVVFSNTLQTATWNNTCLVKGRAEDEVDERVRLKLWEARPMQSGGVLLRYARA